MNRLRQIALGSLASLTFAGAVHAAVPDPKILPTEDEVKKAKEKKDASPWDPGLVFGANLALSSSNNVVGQPHGDSISGGINVLAQLDYLEGKVDWRNSLKVQEVYSRTPIVPEFVKSVDALSFESILYYLLSDIAGPFASFKLDTSIFEGDDVRAAAVDYTLNGEIIGDDVTRIKLTDGFQRLTMKEAVGVFLGPVTTPEIELDMRAGFGAMQTFAKGGRIVADDPATTGACDVAANKCTDLIELAELDDVIQAGIVIGAEAHGSLDGDHVVYAAHAEVLFPVINDDPQNRDALELANFDIGAKLSFKLFSFASLDYEMKILRQPQLVDVWQITNSLYLNFAYTVIE